jgi:hypothetical protein
MDRADKRHECGRELPRWDVVIYSGGGEFWDFCSFRCAHQWLEIQMMESGF